MSSTLNRLTLAVLLSAGAGFLHAAQTQTVGQGVYTAAQANRGEAIYRKECAACHGDSLAGQVGPPLSGDGFLAVWNTEPLSELAGKIRNTMPQGAPGSLTAQETADILAHILRVAGFPAGSTDLHADEAALKQIRWTASNTPPAATRNDGNPAPSFPPAGNLAQVMRGILFPTSNIIFTVQSVDPGAKVTPGNAPENNDSGFNWMLWGAGIYKGWELVDYAAVSLAESAPLMLTPGRRCENGKPVPVNDPDWIKFTIELAEAGKAAYKASQSRDQAAVSEVSNTLADSCLNCHQMFRDKRAPTLNPSDPANKAGRCTK